MTAYSALSQMLLGSGLHVVVDLLPVCHPNPALLAGGGPNGTVRMLLWGLVTDPSVLHAACPQGEYVPSLLLADDLVAWVADEGLSGQQANATLARMLQPGEEAVPVQVGGKAGWDAGMRGAFRGA